MSSPAGPVTSRRTALLALPAAALAAAGLTACTDEDPPPAPAPVDPDVALRAAAADRERALLQAYDDVLVALPDLGARLLPIRAQHAEHLSVLLGPPASASASPAPASAVPSVAPAAPPPPAPPPPAPPPPALPAEALAALAAQERAAGDTHATASLSASRALAGLLASLSASELSHPVALQ